MSDVETGIMPGPEGFSVAWSREDVSPDAAAVSRRQAEAKTFRATCCKGREDGSAWITAYTVPGPILHTFLFDLADEPETVDEVLSVEIVDDGHE